MLLRSVQWWPGSKRAQKQAPGVWPCRRWVGYGKSLKRGGSPDPKKKPSHGKSPVGFRGKTLFQKRPWCFFLFFLQNFDVPKQSSFGPFFFPNLDVFFWDVSSPPLSSAQLPVQLHQFSHGFPWEGGHVSEQWGLDSMFAFKGPYLTP